MISFRPAEERDRAAIRSLLESAGLPLDGIDSGSAEFTVAEMGDRIVGAVALEWYGRDALLRSVVVCPDLRGTKIGSTLVDCMIREARERGGRKIVLLTNTAAAFFSRRGFLSVDRSRLENEALLRSSEFTSVCPQSAQLMVMPLE